MASLHQLPVELIRCVLSFLGTEPPCLRNVHAEPSEQLFHPGSKPLKNLSETCRSLHQLLFCEIFTYLIFSPEHVDSLLSFVKVNKLSNQIKSVVIYHNDLHDHKREGPSKLQTRTAMFQILTSIDPGALTIAMPPSCMSAVTAIDIDLKSEWLFRIPFQILRLEQPSPPVCRQSRPTGLSIFDCRRWTHCTYNEGSSMPAYKTYEHFNFKIPSIIRSLDMANFVQGPPLENLTSFDLVTVFPFGHIQYTLQFFTSLRSLQILRTQMAPEIGSESSKITSGGLHAPQPDFWTEFENIYQELKAWVLRSCPPHLRTFVVLDFRNEGLRERVLGLFSRQDLPGWKHQGRGEWVKQE